MNISVESRAHRTLRNTKNYQKIDLSSLSKIYGDAMVAFYDGEQPIGIYKNHDKSLNYSVVVTNIGLRVFTSHRWAFIKYKDIDTASSKLTTRDVPVENVNELFLNLSNGSTYILPVLGKDGRYKDLFEFHRFISRVIDDINGR